MTDRAFFVTVVDGKRVGFLAGPYDAHEQALAVVDEARRLACDADPWAWFYAFGTSSAPTKTPTVFGIIDGDS